MRRALAFLALPVVVVLAAVVPVAAQYGPNAGTPYPTSPPRPIPDGTPAPRSGELPVTGSTVDAALLVLAAVLVVGGLVLLRARKRLNAS